MRPQAKKERQANKMTPAQRAAAAEERRNKMRADEAEQKKRKELERKKKAEDVSNKRKLQEVGPVSPLNRPVSPFAPAHREFAI